ncbi:hypothetical protein G5V59_27430 [Nocardioides sp. W3-2-3]|uniref:DUF4192 family protein n=1 Tax=Nocardioides convexus TaxID=2712224 RepID=UPI0024184B0F|nr:DUF4192 family protein [Nocardioides convexus]NHA02115.1 hypothetical protein [Nocardioides convexus]
MTRNDHSSRSTQTAQTRRRRVRPAQIVLTAQQAQPGFNLTDHFMVVPLYDTTRPCLPVEHPHDGASLIDAAAFFGALGRRYPGPVALLAFTRNRSHAHDAVTAVAAMLDDVCEVEAAFCVQDLIEGTGVVEVGSWDVVDVITQDDREAFAAVADAHRHENRPMPPAQHYLPDDDGGLTGYPFQPTDPEQRRRQMFRPEAQVPAATIDAAERRLAMLTGNPAAMGTEQRWTKRTVRALAYGGTRPGEATAARLLCGAQRSVLSRHAITQVSPFQANDHVDVWADLYRRAPQGYATQAALLLTWALYVAGDRTLAAEALHLSQHDPDDAFANDLRALLK